MQGARDKALARGRSSTTGAGALIAALAPACRTAPRPSPSIDALVLAGRACRHAAVDRTRMSSPMPRVPRRRRPPSGGRAVHCARRSCPTTWCFDDARPHADRHRPEHGRQVHPYAPDRPHRGARAHRQLRAGASARRLGPIDRIFTRIGAGDDLAGGRSTFVVEMTGGRLISCTTPLAQSLILMDEIGLRHQHLRWTGARVRDGSAAARLRWPFTLFATHYFELTQLAGRAATPARTCISTRDRTRRRHRFPACRESRALPTAATKPTGRPILAGVPREVIVRGAPATSKLSEVEPLTTAAC